MGPGRGIKYFMRVIWGGISDYLGRARVRPLAYFVLMTSYLLFALIPSAPGYYLSAVFFGLSAWSIPTIMAATAGDIGRSQTRPGRPRFCHPLFRYRPGPGTDDRRFSFGCHPFLFRALSISRRGFPPGRPDGHGNQNENKTASLTKDTLSPK